MTFSSLLPHSVSIHFNTPCSISEINFCYTKTQTYTKIIRQVFKHWWVLESWCFGGIILG